MHMLRPCAWLLLVIATTTLASSFSFPSPASFPSSSTTSARTPVRANHSTRSSSSRGTRSSTATQRWCMADTSTTTNNDDDKDDDKDDDDDMELIPQSETGAATFPYRGEGVRVGVLDTGVDPSLLSFSAGGKRCLENVYDCTGSGDVVLRDATATRTDNGWIVEGLSGRSYLLPESRWNVSPFPPAAAAAETEEGAAAASAPLKAGAAAEDAKEETPTTTTTTVRIGIKAAYEFYPSALVQRLRRERKEKLARDLVQATAMVRSQLAQLQAQTKPSATDLLERDNAQALLELLNDEDDHVEDPGPILDLSLIHI